MAEFTANGVALHVQRLGDGSDQTVVFLHGLVMDNLSSWFFTAATSAAQDSDVLLYDLRGHGRSERPAAGYTVDDMVDDLAGLLDALDIDEPVHLVGNSFGGLLAVSLAIAHPHRAASLVLVDGQVLDEDWGAEMQGTLGLEGEERDLMIASSFRDWLGRHSERKRNRLADNARALVYETSLVADLMASPPWEPADLEALDVPALLLYGSESDVRERGEMLASLLPASELRIVEGATHSILWEATEDMKSAILDHLT